MPKISVVVLAGTESHADLGRVLNALELVKEASLRQRLADGFDVVTF